MSDRFHVGPNGPGKCTATVKACPFGGESGSENHYDTWTEAVKAFDAQNAEKFLVSMSKGKSFPPWIDNSGVIDLKFSNKEIAKILKDHPTASVLEPGRYIAPMTGDLTGAIGEDYPEYIDAESEIEENTGNPFVESSDEELRAYAEKNNLETDQLRFLRDIEKADYDMSKFPATKGFAGGLNWSGYRNDVSYLDYEMIQKEYPGIFGDDGRLKFLGRAAPVFELKNRAPVISAYATGGSEELLHAHQEADGKLGAVSKDISPFTIGDPLTGKGSFFTDEYGLGGS